jgi:hypothetical protein
MIVVSGADSQGASIPIRGCTCTVSRTHSPAIAAPERRGSVRPGLVATRSSFGGPPAATGENQRKTAVAKGGEPTSKLPRQSWPFIPPQRLLATSGEASRTPVTPEVAGSSPVAPVSRSACRTASSVVSTDESCDPQQGGLLPDGTSLSRLFGVNHVQTSKFPARKSRWCSGQQQKPVIRRPVAGADVSSASKPPPLPQRRLLLELARCLALEVLHQLGDVSRRQDHLLERPAPVLAERSG